MVWVFGYGSLTWKVGFPYVSKRIGHVKGFVRRFYWWSLDHRGVPGAPGRVVNVLSTGNEDDVVWGIAYEIDDQVWAQTVCAQLDHREKGGYKQNLEKIYPDPEEGETFAPFEAIVYRGAITDEQYAGPASLEEMADTIYTSRGPSGDNKEYLFNLADALRDVIKQHDPHVEELETAVRKLEKRDARKRSIDSGYTGSL